MRPNEADAMASSGDPDQTAPLGAVWSGSALFVQTCPSQYVEFLWLLDIKSVTGGDYNRVKQKTLLK